MSTLAANTAPAKLKKQLRDVTRLISRPNLPADVRREQERKLQHLRILLEERQQKERVKKVKSRYAKVRFFESKKANRHLRQASKALVDNPTDEMALKKWKKAQKDEIYVLNFPQAQKYISLFPSSSLEDAKVLASREKLWTRLAIETGFNEEDVKLEEAVAMAKRILKRDGPETVEERAMEAGEQAIRLTNQTLSGANKRREKNEGNDDEDDDDDEGAEEDDDNDEEGEELSDQDEEDYSSDDENIDEDEEEDEEDDEDDESYEDDDEEDEEEGNDSGSDDNEDDDDDDEEDEDEDEDDEQEFDEEDGDEDDEDDEGSSPKKARR